MEKSWLIDLKRPILRNYEKFFLSRNPFPSIGIPGEGPLITVDREQIIKKFQNVIGDFLQTTNSSITVLVGGYGSGKSHMLRAFKYNVNLQLSSKENGVLAVYIKSPGESFRDFVSEFIEDIGKERLTQYSEEIIDKFIKNHRDIVLKNACDNQAKNEIKRGKYQIGSVVAKSTHIPLFKKIRNTYFSDKETNTILSFLSLAHPEHSSKAWRWFLGEKLSKDDMGTLAITSCIDSAERAYDVFKDIIFILKKIDINHLALFVDELEKIAIIHRTKRAKYQDDIRHMIDEFPNNLCFYFAVSPREWEALTSESTALMRRLAGSWYVLGEFNNDYTRELIEEYLASARKPSYSTKIAEKTFPDCDPSLAPFTNESIEIIRKKTDGVVSDILLLSKRLLEYLCDYSKQYKSVTKKLVDYVSKREGL